MTTEFLSKVTERDLAELDHTDYSFNGKITKREWWKKQKDSSQEWLSHRLDGPAVESNILKEWWYHGKYIKVKSQEEFESWLVMQVFE